ncbi:MAG: methyltransferase domain-containing protein [Gemmatimonadales bacterium]|nr:methyltransferase domain-containing protein [Gemmatimonadales bacterium]
MTTEFFSEQFDSAYPDGVEYHWWLLARSRIVASAVAAFAGPRSAVLEIGCGRGIVVTSLRDAGIDCSGVELAQVEPIDAAKEHVRVGIDAAALPDAERRRYDTILLLDVIEHLPEPSPFLQEFAGAFPNLSRVIVTVPARQELWSNYDEFYGHYRRYTPELLDALASELGWTLGRTSYFFHLVYLPAWLMIKLKRSRATRITPPRGVGRLVHRLLSRAMVVDYYVFPRRLVGTSVLGCFTVEKDAARIR